MSDIKLKSPFDYRLKEVIISADRFERDIDITSVIAQLDISENINRPFLIGNIVISDTTGLLERINFVGTEKVNVKLHIISEQNTEPKIINKNFNITGIKKSVQTGQEATISNIEIIEDHGYRNYLENVNRPYEGNATKIIEDCIKEFLDKELEKITEVNTDLAPLKCIIPNWHPLDVVKWLTKYMIRDFGFPYFFYSTIHSDKIQMNDLLHILKEPIVNPKTAFKYSSSSANDVDASIHEQSYVINEIEFNSNLNTLDKIREGVVGSTNQSVDIIKNSSSREIQHFDIYQMFKNIKANGAIKANQSYIPYDSKAKVNDKVLHDYDSRRISELKVSYVYGKDILNFTNVMDLDKQLLAKSILTWLNENKVRINVPGRNFLETDDRKAITLGDQIQIKVLKPIKNTPGNVSIETDEDIYDKKRSGEYVIQAIRHMFVFDRYNTIAECTKLTDIENTFEKI